MAQKLLQSGAVVTKWRKVCYKVAQRLLQSGTGIKSFFFRSLCYLSAKFVSKTINKGKTKPIKLLKIHIFILNEKFFPDENFLFFGKIMKKTSQIA